MADDDRFERVNIGTLRALERRGLITKGKKLGRGKHYTQQYLLSELGRSVLASVQQQGAAQA